MFHLDNVFLSGQIWVVTLETPAYLSGVTGENTVMCPLKKKTIKK